MSLSDKKKTSVHSNHDSKVTLYKMNSRSSEFPAQRLLNTSTLASDPTNITLGTSMVMTPLSFAKDFQKGPNFNDVFPPLELIGTSEEAGGVSQNGLLFDATGMNDDVPEDSQTQDRNGVAPQFGPIIELWGTTEGNPEPADGQQFLLVCYNTKGRKGHFVPVGKNDEAVLLTAGDRTSDPRLYAGQAALVKYDADEKKYKVQGEITELGPRSNLQASRSLTGSGKLSPECLDRVLKARTHSKAGERTSEGTLNIECAPVQLAENAAAPLPSFGGLLLPTFMYTNPSIMRMITLILTDNFIDQKTKSTFFRANWDNPDTNIITSGASNSTLFFLYSGGVVAAFSTVLRNIAEGGKYEGGFPTNLKTDVLESIADYIHEYCIDFLGLLAQFLRPEFENDVYNLTLIDKNSDVYKEWRNHFVKHMQIMQYAVNQKIFDYNIPLLASMYFIVFLFSLVKKDSDVKPVFEPFEDSLDRDENKVGDGMSDASNNKRWGQALMRVFVMSFYGSNTVTKTTADLANPLTKSEFLFMMGMLPNLSGIPAAQAVNSTNNLANALYGNRYGGVTRTGDLAKITEKVSSNCTKSRDNKQNIEINTQQIGKNTTDIAKNKSKVQKNTKEIKENKEHVQKNTKEIKKNAHGIAKNKRAIDCLTCKPRCHRQHQKVCSLGTGVALAGALLLTGLLHRLREKKRA